MVNGNHPTRRIQTCPHLNCGSDELMGWTKSTPEGGVPGFKCGHCGLTFVEARIVFVAAGEEYKGAMFI